MKAAQTAREQRSSRGTQQSARKHHSGRVSYLKADHNILTCHKGKTLVTEVFRRTSGASGRASVDAAVMRLHKRRRRAAKTYKTTGIRTVSHHLISIAGKKKKKITAYKHWDHFSFSVAMLHLTPGRQQVHKIHIPPSLISQILGKG